MSRAVPFPSAFGPAALFLFASLLPLTTANADVAVSWIADSRGVSIATDVADNVFTVDYEHALGADITLTKRTAAGTLLWIASEDHTQGSFWERAEWVATDSDGNALVCGTRMSGFSNPVTAASVVMKYGPDGTLLWRHLYETGFDGSFTRRCLVDADDNVYVLGMGIGPSGFVTKVKKFAPDGSALWTYFDSAGVGRPINFKFTPDGDIVIVGRAQIGSINGYARITRDGEPIWSLAGVESLTVGDCAGDAFGNTYVVHGEYATNGGTVLRKLDPNGASVWQSVFALAGFRVEIGGDQHAVVSGFPDTGSPGAAFIKVDPDGDLVWQNLDADGSLALLLHAHMLLDAQGNAYLAAGTLFQMAVCKVGADGASHWTVTIPGGSAAHAIALGHDAASVYVVGGTTARLIDDTPQPLPADLDGDGIVGGADLGLLLSAWGRCPTGNACAADLNGDDVVDGGDLGILLAAWGA